MYLGIIIILIVWVISMLILVAVIRSALDSSKTSDKLDRLIDEIRLLRKDIKENKHIVDKRV